MKTKIRKKKQKKKQYSKTSFIYIFICNRFQTLQVVDEIAFWFVHLSGVRPVQTRRYSHINDSPLKKNFL